MDWIEVARMISELGILILCGAMVLAIFWMNYKRNSKKDDEKDDKLDAVMNKIQEQNELLVNQVVNGVVKHNLSNEENSNLTYIEQQINDYLKELQLKLDACRVSLVRFHNGNKGMDGLSFLKMSMTNEVVKLGVSPIMQEFQNYFRSFLAYWVRQLEKTGYCLIDDVEDLKEEDSTMYNYLKSRGVKSKAGIAIKNTAGINIGFICVEYVNKRAVNTTEVCNCLKEYQIKVETLLNINPNGNWHNISKI